MVENNHTNDTVDNTTQAHPTENQDTNSCERELQECREQMGQIKERYAYLNAEFENYKKRMEKQRTQWVDSAQAALLTDILPIVDNFERALEQLKQQQLPEQVASYLTGFELIAKELYKFLKNNNLEEIADSAVFDPEFHEAIMQVNNPEYQSGDIVSVLRKGYTHKGHVIRPAQVSVAQ